MLNLSVNQARFAMLLDEQAPELFQLWDFKKREFKKELVDRYLSSASHGEVILCKFFLGLWLGRNDFEFDLFEAIQNMDRKSLKIIMDWLADPFWP